VDTLTYAAMVMLIWNDRGLTFHPVSHGRKIGLACDTGKSDSATWPVPTGTIRVFGSGFFSNETGRKGGRPRKVDDADHVATAKRMKSDGYTGKQIAQSLGEPGDSVPLPRRCSCSGCVGSASTPLTGLTSRHGYQSPATANPPLRLRMRGAGRKSLPCPWDAPRLWRIAAGPAYDCATTAEDVLNDLLEVLR
jgi:hypothetical protein